MMCQQNAPDAPVPQLNSRGVPIDPNVRNAMELMGGPPLGSPGNPYKFERPSGHTKWENHPGYVAPLQGAPGVAAAQAVAQQAQAPVPQPAAPQPQWLPASGQRLLANGQLSGPMPRRPNPAYRG